MNFTRLQEYLKELKEPNFRFKQILQFYFEKYPADWQKFTNLPLKLRENLEKNVKINDFSENKIEISQTDNTKKALLKLQDGALIETVYIPLKEGVRTACVSCQVGCPMGCAFCATGQMGLTRNLTADEITNQIIYWNQQSETPEEKINRIVFMGMGEPLLNLKEIIKSIKFLNLKETLNLNFKRFTISTCGIVPSMYKLLDENLAGVNLAVSLHAPDNETRDKLMPINKQYPLEKLMEFCAIYSKQTKEKIFFEYVMLKNINDSQKMAQNLADLLKKIPFAHVNLIPYNSCSTKFKTSEEKTILNFQKILKQNNIETFIRKSAGKDIKAACGQLKTKNMLKN